VRILFFGSPAFAVPTLDALTQSAHDVVGVVTQPDRPRGRGQQVTPGAVAAAARAAGLPLVQPATLAEGALRATLAAFEADLGVVAAYGRLLPDWLLALPPRGLINVHASLLPAFRGAAPVHRAVMAGHEETGVTIMRVVKALDAGPMLDRVVVPIPLDVTSEELEGTLAVAGARLLVPVVDRLAIGPVHEEPQDDRLATYAPKITRADSPIAWEASARAIHDRIRGLHPWPHASTTLAGRRVIVHRSTLPGDETTVSPGRVVASSARGIDAAAGDRRIVRVLELQLEGGRRLAAAGFLAGHAVPAGTQLG
jgi:methionyl-tRNA formyltransferase